MIHLPHDILQYLALFLNPTERFVLKFVNKELQVNIDCGRPSFSDISHLPLTFFRWIIHEWKLQKSKSLFPLAVKCRSTECVNEVLFEEYYCGNTAYAFSLASQNGDVQMLSFLEKNGLLPMGLKPENNNDDNDFDDWDPVCPYVLAVVESGNVKAFEWFLERHIVLRQENGYKLYFAAIKNYHKEMFDYIYNVLRVPLQQSFFSDPVEYCARYDRFDLMRWMVNEKKMSLNAYCMAAAVSSRSTQIVHWLYSHECPIDYLSVVNAVKNKDLDMIDTLLSWKPELRLSVSICSEAAAFSDITILRYVREKHGCVWNKSVVKSAAQKGNLHIMKWCIRKGCEWDFQCIPSCIQNNHLHVLKWAYRQRATFTPYHFWYAVVYNRVNIVKWLFKKKCPFDAVECVNKSPSTTMTRLLTVIVKKCTVK